MIKLLHLVAIGALVSSAFYAYTIKYETTLEAEQLQKIRMKAQRERDARRDAGEDREERHDQQHQQRQREPRGTPNSATAAPSQRRWRWWRSHWGHTLFPSTTSRYLTHRLAYSLRHRGLDLVILSMFSSWDALSCLRACIDT